MTHTCHECGAVLTEDTSCKAIFDSLLALEFSDPGYGRSRDLMRQWARTTIDEMKPWRA